MEQCEGNVESIGEHKRNAALFVVFSFGPGSGVLLHVFLNLIRHSSKKHLNSFKG